MSDDLFSLAAARAAKQEAMERVDGNANPAWSIEMLALVTEVALAKPYFTSDDVFELALERNLPTTHEPRAFGPVMMKAAKQGICAKANVAPKISRRASLHGSPRAVWESLIYEGVR
jgi:hypothetical protein